MLHKADYSLLIKREILAAVSNLPCCRQSFLAGLLSGGHHKSFVRTRRGLIKRLTQYLNQMFESNQRVVVVGTRLVLPDISLLELRRKFVDRFNLIADAKITSSHCQTAFMQGLFIAHGYIQNPRQGYHLEVRLKGRWLPAAFKKTARFLKFRFASYTKGNYRIFYIKSGQRIIRFLNRLGAFNKALELSDFIATRKILSVVNRQVNSETANINRLVNAAEKSILNIQALIELPEQNFWTENLYETALMRLKYPQDSIKKLGTRFNPPLTKSAVNHRLRRINAIYCKIFKTRETNNNSKN